MPYSEQMADQMRADLGLLPGLSEKNMFAAPSVLLPGHVICGVHKGGAMFRPGKPRKAQALTKSASLAPKG